MIAAWWSQYGEFVEVRFFADWVEFEADREDTLETFTSYRLISVREVGLS
jgi:hypothetical protein